MRKRKRSNSIATGPAFRSDAEMNGSFVCTGREQEITPNAVDHTGAEILEHQATACQGGSRSEVSQSRDRGNGARENGLDGLAELINGKGLCQYRAAGISQNVGGGIAGVGGGEYDPCGKFGAILFNPLIEPGGR